MRNVIVVIQARMGSTRLPGKVLMDINGKPLLSHLIERLSGSKFRPQIIVATSVSKNNDPLVDFLKQKSIAFFRGSEDDVLSRFTSILKLNDADVIVRATADDPLMSCEYMDYLIERLIADDLDYVFMRGLPKGVSVEVISKRAFVALETCNYLSSSDKEHVTLYIKNNPQLFSVKFFEAPAIHHYPELGLTIDTPEEMKIMRQIFAAYGNDVTLSEAIRFLVNR